MPAPFPQRLDDHPTHAYSPLGATTIQTPPAYKIGSTKADGATSHYSTKGNN